MLAADALEQVRLIMMDVFDLDELSLSSASSAEDIKEWDSLSHIRLVVALEKEFKIKFKNSELESLKNVGDLTSLVAAKAG